MFKINIGILPKHKIMTQRKFPAIRDVVGLATIVPLASVPLASNFPNIVGAETSMQLVQR